MNSHKGILRLDLPLLIPTLVLVILSLTTLLSINKDLFFSQLIFFLFSIAGFLFFSQVHYKILQQYAFLLYITSIILLVIILIIGIESRGAVRWIDIFGLRIQFSEICKPFFAVSLATYLSKRDLTFSTFGKALLLLFPILFLIYKQPDLGNALVYFFAVAVSFVIIGFPLWWFGLGFLGAGLLSPLFWKMLHGYQKERITSFLHPSDPLGTSYNAIQSIIAVGSGMVLGKGFSESTQSGLRFLPERHTDFIFATLSESLGLVGGIVVLTAFFFLLFRIYAIFSQSHDRFTKQLCAFSFSFILVQCVVNIGMNIGIVPIVGITLPFVSYGGSSLLSNFILLGLLTSATHLSKDKDTLEIR